MRTLKDVPIIEPVPLNNLDSPTSPGSWEDGVHGYSIGSKWIDLTTSRIYICVNAAASSAIWSEIVGVWENMPASTINFFGLQAQGFRLESRTSDPQSPSAGQLWLRTDL